MVVRISVGTCIQTAYPHRWLEGIRIVRNRLWTDAFIGTVVEHYFLVIFFTILKTGCPTK